KFQGGRNIALKIPKISYQQTLDFYKNILKLEVVKVDIGDHPTISQSHKMVFGESMLWLDCVDNYTHSEVWLELKTDNVEQATQYLDRHGIKSCDELEKIPENSHWIKDPSGTVFILNR
ncbi:MAG: VOC family protein, partial [Vicingaceae bacterium]